MDYIHDWDKRKERLTALWQNEVVDRGCVAVVAPKVRNGYQYPPAPTTPEGLHRWYMDGPSIADREEARFERMFFGGDSFPLIWSNFGTAGHAKYIRNARYRFTPETVWFDPTIDDWETQAPVFDPQSPALLADNEAMRYLCERAKGRYMVSMPDNCGVLDAVAHLRGTDRLAMDLYDEPERVVPAAETLLTALKTACTQQFEILRKNNEGGVTHGWMFTWAPGPQMQLQVDFSVMISPQMYEEFALPELDAMTHFLDYAVYHLDGQEQIRHLDMILSQERLNMIQWTPVAGQPPTSDFLPVLQRIQKAGKGLVLYPAKNEVEKLLDGLSIEGLYLHVRDAEDEAEAREIVKLVEQRGRVRR